MRAMDVHQILFRFVQPKLMRTSLPFYESKFVAFQEERDILVLPITDLVRHVSEPVR
jgi:hypothetical protein